MKKQSDLLGPTAYPGSTPQAEEEYNMVFPDSVLDELKMTQEPQTKEYRWIWGNGQIHVSPIHDHDELMGHANLPKDHNGPLAAGYVSVTGNDAVWSIETNMALTGLVKQLEEYTENVGWDWGGLIGGDGSPISEDFAKKSMMYFRWNKEKDMLEMRKQPFKRSSGCVYIVGKKYAVEQQLDANADKRAEAVEEWANDYGYEKGKISRDTLLGFWRTTDYPGGTDITDRVKNKEELMVGDRGDPEWEPGKNENTIPEGPFKCKTCGEKMDSFNAYQLHAKDHEQLTEVPFEDGHFPTIEDMDAVLPLRRKNVNPTAMPLLGHKEASKIENFQVYSNTWNFEADENVVYGGYLNGLKGYAVIKEGSEPELLMVYSSEPKKGIGTALIEKIQQHYPNFYTHANTEEGQRLLEKCGVVNTDGLTYRYAAGQEPKDLIQAAVPFVYDIQNDHITTGHPGMKTHDIMGSWNPGGIVEGYYEPGGKMTIITQTNMPYSLYHLLQMWYYQHPHMEITGVETENPKGETTKIAAEDIGSYIRTLAATDPAAWNSYQALRKAGGKVYVVGGAVRDALLQKEPKDIDMMVAGIPSEEVQSILEHLPGTVNLTGKRFGVYRYNVKGNEVEIALPRSDSYEGAEKRSQGKITVDPNLPIEQDLLRRDFTANSMAVELDSGKLIDPYGGSKDIENHALRTTHPSSFSEDPTRLLRSLVTYGKHGLVPDEQTRAEITENAHRLDDESPDALKPILYKLMETPDPAKAIRLAQETGMLKHIFPELATNFDYDQNNPYHSFTLGDHSLKVLENISKKTNDPDLRLAALLHDVGKPASAWVDPVTGFNHYYEGMDKGQPIGANHADVGADMVDNRLRTGFNLPTSSLAKIHHTIKHHMFNAFESPKGARKFLNKMGENADNLLTLREADMEGKHDEEQNKAEQMKGLVNQVRNEAAPTELNSLAINGNDIINLGVKPGPQIGQILNNLMEAVISEPRLNNPTNLSELAQQYIGQ